jgi:hypothetical protein
MVNLGRLEVNLIVEYESFMWLCDQSLSILHFSRVVFGLTDGELYCRTCGWDWFFWCCFPSKLYCIILLLIYILLILTLFHIFEIIMSSLCRQNVEKLERLLL